MITIATNMAGRGTDIVLGNPEPEVSGYVMMKLSEAERKTYTEVSAQWKVVHEGVSKGGLHIVGTDVTNLVA